MRKEDAWSDQKWQGRPEAGLILEVKGREFNIEQMSLEDVEVVFQIEVECFPSPWPLQSFGLAVRDPSVNALVVRSENRVVGFLIAMNRGEYLLIADLAVNKDFRRQGVARQLIRTALAEGRKQDLTSAVLDVRESNYEAIQLYSDFGFRVIGTRKGYYSNPPEDALVMLMKLEAWH